MEQTQQNEQTSPRPSALWKWAGRFFRLLIMIVVIGVSGGISYYWLANRPRTERRPPRPESVLVEVAPIKKNTEQIIVTAMGTIVPATQIQLAARVNGQVVGIHPQFQPGGYIEQGATILEIDPTDYELAVRQQAGNLVRAESEVRLEMGQQAVAQREFELLMDETIEEGNFELLLREPQLAAKEAAVEIARATLDKAQLDLERTRVTAPFNAVVKTRNADIGAYVTPGSALAALIGTDVFWIEIAVPMDELQFIPLPDADGDEGATVRVYHEAAWGVDAYRSGRVVRLLPDLELQGRMARLLVMVEDPLNHADANNGQPPMLLGTFVRVAVEGRYLEDVTTIPRTAFHGADSVWIMDNDNLLEIRKVQPVWGTRDYVYVAEELEDGELLVVSDLATPTPGLPLRTADMKSERPGQPGRGAGRQGGQS